MVGRPLAHTLVEALRFSLPVRRRAPRHLGIAQAAGPFVGLARVGGRDPASPGSCSRSASLLGGAVGVADARSPRVDARPSPPLAVAAGAARRRRPRRSSPRVATAPASSSTSPRCRAAASRARAPIDVPSRLVTERHLDATAAIEPDPDLDLVVWPENVDRRRRLRRPATSSPRSPPRPPGSACRSPSASPRTSRRAGSLHQRPGHRDARRRGRQPLRQGAPGPVRRVRAAARAARGARRAGRPGAHDAVAGTGPAVLDLPRRHPRSPWSSRGRCSSAAGPARASATAARLHPQPDERGQLQRHDRADPAGGVEPAAGRSRPAAGSCRWRRRGSRAFVTPDGDVIDRTAVGERAVIRHAVELRTGRTWYVSLGDGPFAARPRSVAASRRRRVAELGCATAARASPAGRPSALEQHA